MAKWAKESQSDMVFGPFESKGIFMDIPGMKVKLPEDDQGSLLLDYFASPDDIESKPLYDPMNRKECPNLTNTWWTPSERSMSPAGRHDPGLVRGPVDDQRIPEGHRPASDGISSWSRDCEEGRQAGAELSAGSSVLSSRR